MKKNKEKRAVLSFLITGLIITGVFGCNSPASDWNGERWKQFAGTETPSFYGYYQAVSVKGDMVVAVGVNASGIDSQAIILMATRR